VPTLSVIGDLTSVHAPAVTVPVTSTIGTSVVTGVATLSESGVQTPASTSSASTVPAAKSSGERASVELGMWFGVVGMFLGLL